jgi:hypothetical protein
LKREILEIAARYRDLALEPHGGMASLLRLQQLRKSGSVGLPPLTLCELELFRFPPHLVLIFAQEARDFYE